LPAGLRLDTFAAVTTSRRVPAIAGTAALLLALAGPALADPVCTQVGGTIQCSASGSSTGTWTRPGHSTPAWPVRFLGTLDLPGSGPCWFWSPWPPGLDSWDPGHDQEIIWTRWSLPECPEGTPGKNTPDLTVVRQHAWEVFRALPLAAPRPHLQPADHGITGLPTHAWAPAPLPIHYRESLPDTTLEVRAGVTAVIVDWGDGTPPVAYDPGSLLPYPSGSVHHTFALKTCPAAYRATHPSGGTCHPGRSGHPRSGRHSRLRRGRGDRCGRGIAGPWYRPRYVLQVAHMRSIGIRELRQHASRYLRLVADGESLQVTDRGRPVALLVPVPARTSMEHLCSAGRMTEASGDLLDLGSPPPPAAGIALPGDALVAAGLDER